jgi:hypothetical protein
MNENHEYSWYALAMKMVLFLILGLLNSALAVDMVNPSEQYYVTQGLFAELGIEPVSCEIEDAVINFACGQFEGDAATFQQAFDAYVTANLPGLYLAVDWFQNGPSVARDYRSSKGRYLFSYNPGGYIVVAFIPK